MPATDNVQPDRVRGAGPSGLEASDARRRSIYRSPDGAKPTEANPHPYTHQAGVSVRWDPLPGPDLAGNSPRRYAGASATPDDLAPAQRLKPRSPRTSAVRSSIIASLGMPVESATRTRPLKMPTVAAASTNFAGPRVSNARARAASRSSVARTTASANAVRTEPSSTPPSAASSTAALRSTSSPTAWLLARSSMVWAVVQ